MNTIKAVDYRTEMQQHALSFLQRHYAQYLSADDCLFGRAVQYLVESLAVPQFLAPRLVELAMSELGEKKPIVSVSHFVTEGAMRVVLIDNRTGERMPIPTRILPARLALQANSL